MHPTKMLYIRFFKIHKEQMKSQNFYILRIKKEKPTGAAF